MIGDAPLSWLLEPENPSARYLTLTDLLDHRAEDDDVVMARQAIPAWGPARTILDAQWPAGYWMRPGIGYSPKYKATVWQVVFLAAMGAPRTEAVDRACAYVLDQSRLPDGRFSAYKTAKGATACLNGNLLRAFFLLGYEDPRLGDSLEALASMVSSDRFCCRFNAPSPIPAHMGEGLPCAWGAIKALAAFAVMSPELRSPAVQGAIQSGISFLLRGGLVSGDYPSASGPSRLWRRFSFPLGYHSDLLEVLDVLGRLGATAMALDCEPKVEQALALALKKRDSAGRWTSEYHLPNTWATFGPVGLPSKWVTIRALRALRHWPWNRSGTCDTACEEGQQCG